MARHVRVVVAGEGEALADLHALAESLGVGGRVTFTGRLDEDALTRHLGQCRAVCFAPLREDYGFVTAEAFASGKAVVTCSDSGGPAELVTHERRVSSVAQRVIAMRDGNIVETTDAEVHAEGAGPA